MHSLRTNTSLPQKTKNKKRVQGKKREFTYRNKTLPFWSLFRFLRGYEVGDPSGSTAIAAPTFFGTLHRPFSRPPCSIFNADGSTHWFFTHRAEGGDPEEILDEEFLDSKFGANWNDPPSISSK